MTEMLPEEAAGCCCWRPGVVVNDADEDELNEELTALLVLDATL